MPSPQKMVIKGWNTSAIHPILFIRKLTASQQRMMRDDVRHTTKKHFWGLHHLNIMQSEFQIEAATTQPLSGVNTLVICIILERTFVFSSRWSKNTRLRFTFKKANTRGGGACVWRCWSSLRAEPGGRAGVFGLTDGWRPTWRCESDGLRTDCERSRKGRVACD